MSATTTSNTMSAALPREILTWLQSLNLGNAVKNPKRDLANGLVIAQICAHYWTQVPLHSFANGVSTSSKQSNWYVLQKVMRKHDTQVSPAMVTGMVSGTDGCAEAFLKQLYTLFTGKTVEETPVPLAEPLTEVSSKDVPVLAPATANSAVARPRQAAENTSMSGPVNGVTSTSSPSSRYPSIQNSMGRKPLNFGVSSASSEAYLNNNNSSASAASGFATVTSAGSNPRTAGTATVLPPIAPPRPAEAMFSAAALTSGKPALNVSVRPAGQVSTVLPTSPVDGAEAGTPTNSKKAEVILEEGQYPPGTSFAAAWFCAKVRDALPAEALETLANNRSRTMGPLTPLSSAVFWLSTADGVSEADFSHSGGDEIIRESQVALRQRVWQSLLAHVHEVADVVMHWAPHGLDVLIDTLFSAVRDTVVCSDNEDDGREVAAGVVFVRNTLHLCTTLLAQLSDADCSTAVRCFQMYFVASEAFAGALCQMKWCVAQEYARLLVTVLPLNRGAAVTVLESLWSSLETVVRDAANAAAGENGESSDAQDVTETEGGTDCELPSLLSGSADVSLLTLLRALVEVLLPYDTGAAATPLRHTPPSSATGGAATASAASDGTRTPLVTTRRPSARMRNVRTATSIEENVFTGFVARFAHKRCTDVLRELQRAYQRHSHHSAKHAATAAAVVGVDLSPTELLLLKTAAALAVDLLRVELTVPLMTEFVSGEAFFDVFHALFPSAEFQKSTEATSLNQEPHQLQHKSLLLVSLKQDPTLAVLRARWLRWCLQRQWQCGLLRHSSNRRAGNSVTASLWQQTTVSQRRTSSLAGSTAGTSDGGNGGVTDRDMWSDSEEMRVMSNGLQAVCCELFTVLDRPTEVGEKRARVCQAAKVLVASAMAEALPFLPPQYKEDLRAPRYSIHESGGALRRATQLLSVHSVGGSDEPDNASGGVAQGEFPYAEAVAEACLHVLMRETTPLQMHALLRGAPRALSKANISETETPQQLDGTKAKSAEGEEAVCLTHPFVGLLAPYGPLVLRSDALLLVKAMLCVLDSTHTAATKTTEKDVAAVARRLGARAAIVAREGQVEEGLAARVAWMHALLVDGRRNHLPSSSTSVAATPAAISAATSEVAPPLLSWSSAESAAHRLHPVAAPYDDAVVAQWHTIILECWDSFMVVLQAATLRLRQRGGAAAVVTAISAGHNTTTSCSATNSADAALLREALGERLLCCAQNAQEVVCCLEHELSAALPDHAAATTTTATMAATEMSTSMPGRGDGVTLNSALLSGPLASFVSGVTAETLQAAVTWMWSVVGEP